MKKNHLPVKNGLPPFGMPPAGGIGTRPEFIEPEFPPMPGDGDGPGPGGPFPPPSAPNEAYAEIKDGKAEISRGVQVKTEGEIGESGAAGFSFYTDIPELNGIIIKGTSKYEISNSKLSASGNGRDDFSGNGAVIMADDTSEVVIRDTEITTDGCIRPCTISSSTTRHNRWS